jgi:1-aminocyclopropane-1-carboxylate deaminase/D-cysteine desulfhydrase-like pyridoxal-dependent ACC family enzyme
MIDLNKITPIEEYDFQGHKLWLKREDMFEIAGVNGGKVRTCWSLCKDANKGLVTAGSRMSPQVNIVAHIAKYLGIPCRCHTPQGKLSPEVEDAKKCGAEIIQHKAGYNNVIIARAREDAKGLGWTHVPFGMDAEEAVNQTRRQVVNIPKGVKRIVIPVGSGMSLAGLLHGLQDRGLNIPVLGVVVGASPEKRLNKYAPCFWESMTEFVWSNLDYHTEVKDTKLLEEVICDPIYEAKCFPYIQYGDLFWIIGIRKTVKDKINEDKN